MIEEIWRDIPGYEGIYQASNLGRVKSLNYNKTRKEKILKSCNDGDGYLQVNLCKDGKRNTYKVHRLVASAFLDNPDNLPQINHVDENKQNNCLDNLEFCTAEYNSNYGTRNERVTKSNSMPVLQFSLEGEFVKKWDSATQVQREIGFIKTNITKCCKGERKSANKYIWKYEKDWAA